jgi:hypothetical protein
MLLACMAQQNILRIRAQIELVALECRTYYVYGHEWKYLFVFEETSITKTYVGT